jgi:hypothetical protein
VETRETLEAALAASWDRDTLTVYADHLQAEGDPRGELIALDLQIEAHGNSFELAKRRTSLLFAWLGALVPVDNVHASWVGDSMKFGFVEDLQVEGNDPNALARLEQVLESPAGAYVRGLTMSGNTKDLEEAFTVLSRQEHLWLTRFSIGLWNPLPTIDAKVSQQLFAAMPRLESLELRRHAAFGEFSHRTIKKLAIRGATVYQALGTGAAFDAVAELELDLSGGDYPNYEYYDEEYVEEQPPAQPELPDIAFPSLKKLDLSTNGIGNIDAAYQFLRTFDARAHITHVKIPQLRNKNDRDDLVTAIRDMRALEVIEVVHGHYYEPADIPGVRFVRPEPWPWPTEERARGKGMRVFQPNAKYGDSVPLLDAVYLMEQSYEKLPRPARDAWAALWKHVATLEKDAAPFPARVLAEAVEACPSLMANGWRELREELSSRRPFAPDAVVRIERCTA